MIEFFPWTETQKLFEGQQNSRFKKAKQKQGEFRYVYSSRQNIWNKIENFIKTGQDKKSLISTFACFLTAIAKVRFLEGRLGTKLSPSKFEIFLIFSYFLRS